LRIAAGSIFETDAELGDDTELRQRGEHAIVDRLERDNRGVVAPQVLDRVLLGPVVRHAFRVDLRVGIALAQQLHEARMLTERDRGNGDAFGRHDVRETRVALGSRARRP
jgi:hypothetical protein